MNSRIDYSRYDSGLLRCSCIKELATSEEFINPFGWDYGSRHNNVFNPCFVILESRFLFGDLWGKYGLS